MASTINCQGIYDSPTLGRRVAILTVEYNDQIYNWETWIPDGAELSEYLGTVNAKIEAEIDAKEAEWATLEPKTQLQMDRLTGETTEVAIDRASIVKSDVNSMAVTISPRQARLALYDAGLLSQVDSQLASLPDPQRTTAQIEWEYAVAIVRDSQLVESLGQALGLSAFDLDNLFKTAAKL